MSMDALGDVLYKFEVILMKYIEIQDIKQFHR